MEEQRSKSLRELAAELVGQKPGELLNFALYPGGVTLIGKDGRKARLRVDTRRYRPAGATPRTPRFGPPRRGSPRWRPRSAFDPGRYHRVSTRIAHRPIIAIWTNLNATNL